MRTGFLKDHLEKLIAFKVVVDVGSISRAATVLSISQSSLSHSMMTLERAIDTQLLNRKSRGVDPTDAGRVLYDFAKRLQLDIASLESRLYSPADKNSGHLRLATHETLAVHVWPRFLKKLNEKYSQIHISLFSGRVDPIVQGIISDDYHVGVTVEPLSHPKIEMTKLYSGSFGLYVGVKENGSVFSQLKKSTLSVEDLRGIPVMTDVHAHIKQGLPISRYLSELKLGAHHSYEVNSFEAAMRLSAQGLGVAAIPTRNAEEAVNQGLIRKIRVKGISNKTFGAYNICAAYRKDNASLKTIQILISELKVFFK